MRRSINLGWVMVLCLCMKGWTQQPYLGTKTPYMPPHVSYTPPPAGYQPVFINYAGRHGARFLTKAGADQHVLEVLTAAEKDNALTETGKKIWVIAQRLQAAGKGNYENITLLGKEEQEAIGERMHYQYASVFAGKGLEVMTTWKVRTQQSADAFLRGLMDYTGIKRFERAPDSADTILRFYDHSAAYLRYKKSDVVKRSLDSLDKDGRTLATARRICSRLFSPGFIPTGGDIAFADDLYDLYSIAWSMSGELREKAEDRGGLGIAFDRDDLEWMGFRSGAADFLEKGPGFDSVGIQVTVAAPLLRDFIQRLDRATGSGSPAGRDAASPGDAVLRFTHAEAISPFAALLGIRGASTSVTSIYRYHDHWDAGYVIPLSANIQWILYAGKDKNGKDNKGFLVKVLLNEREVELPVVTTQWPYYRWEDLRAYCVERLSICYQ